MWKRLEITGLLTIVTQRYGPDNVWLDSVQLADIILDAIAPEKKLEAYGLYQIGRVRITVELEEGK